MQDGALLILRSTIYPGVTEIINEHIKSLNRKIDVAFCPERIAEGKALEELVTLPQIISAFNQKTMQRASELFLAIAPKVIELHPTEAELAKLFTNSWRYINFAISNQFYMLAERYGFDFHRIYNAVTTDYPRMKSFAKAGFAAGPCLLKDTLQLSAFASNNFFLGHAAMLVNEGLPNFICEQLQNQDLPNKTVAILGMAFKGDSDDIRDSLSYKLKNVVELRAKKVLCTDPFITDPAFVPLEYALSKADILILGAPHSQYKQIQFNPEQLVIDIWGFWSSNNKLDFSIQNTTSTVGVTT
jgi:UDP-N-acetyl-D-mannosaminuronic acid dehydrogenase